MNHYILLARLVAAQLDTDVQLRLDSAGGTTAFARQFEFIETEIARTEFPPLKSEELMFYDSSPPPGTKSVTHRTATQVGRADFVEEYADDLPHADVYTVEDEVPCRTMGVQYHYSVGDLNRAAIDSSFRLDTERKESAVNAMRRLHDEIALIGSVRHGRTGFINSALVPIVTPTTGTWATATSAQICADVVKLWASISTATLDTEAPDTLAMDTDSHAIISSRPYGVDADFTILQWLLKNVDGLKKIVRLDRLRTAGASNTRRLIAYKNTKDVLKYVSPLLFGEQPPQRKALKLVVPCHAETGFTHIRKPLAMAYMDGL